MYYQYYAWAQANWLNIMTLEAAMSTPIQYHPSLPANPRASFDALVSVAHTEYVETLGSDDDDDRANIQNSLIEPKL